MTRLPEKLFIIASFTFPTCLHATLLASSSTISILSIAFAALRLGLRLPFQLRFRDVHLRDDVDEAPRVAGDATGGHRVEAMLAIDEKHHRVGLVRHFPHHLRFPKANRGQEGFRRGSGGGAHLVGAGEFLRAVSQRRELSVKP
eukprot:1190820-Prorocentrum_minimum.AAC.6